MTTHRSTTRFSVLTVPLIVLSACGSTDRAPSNPSSGPITVSTASARRGVMSSTFEAGGIVRARATVLLASQVMASVKAVHVRPGDRVRRGTPLVTLDAREVTANQTRASATLEGNTEAAAAAAGAVRSAEASLALARATRDRLVTLHDRRAATTQERDQAVAAYEAAEGQVQSARAALAGATALRQAAAAGTDAAAAALSYTTLTSPFDGIVTVRHVEPGDMAAPGRPLLVVEDTSVLQLEVTLDEARAARVAVRQTAEVSAGDSGDWTKAAISEIARTAPDSHSFVVTLDLPAGTPTRSGAFYRARFASGTRETLMVPADAVIRRGQLTFVFAVDDEQHARLQPISPGDSSGELLEVLGGLGDGTRVVVNPPATLSEGSRIDEGRR
jgi:RND family efflux transporter MFP subunit